VFLRCLAHTLAMTSLLSLTACQPPALQGLPVRRAGDPIVADAPEKFPPDAPTRTLAKDGAAAAALLAQAFGDFTPLLKALRDKRAQHPAPSGYQLLQVPGWRFFAGGWTLQDTPREVRVTLDDGQDKLIGWDVTDAANYSEGLHPHFPPNATRLRLDIGGSLPAGGRLTASFILPLGESNQSTLATGLGAVAQFGDVGSLTFEALNARLQGDTTLERSDLVLRSTVDGATMLFSGFYGASGLIEAQIIRTGKPAGKLVAAGGERLLFVNESGTFSL